eukprot:TRINITY_DN61051_c0_g1_i1.p2 TRINITY_DN61051_c0_g1~~TRINITY_DN61051_c0_g1_i1.p2  ORF type:complete len:174 (+),score=40.69 TRINITY_DN61051_c0_g1_i1:77-598(+)
MVPWLATEAFSEVTPHGLEAALPDPMAAFGSFAVSRPRGLLTAFTDDTLNAEGVLAMLNPKLKKALDVHPELAKQFTTEMNQQLELVKSDPASLKALRAEMEADVKELNAQVDKDPGMIKLIEQNLARQAKPGVATANMAGALPFVVATSSTPSPSMRLKGAARRRQELADFM